jgi:hypothetical protein
MGPICMFEREHLASSDNMIVQTRLRLLETVKRHAETNAPPPGVDDPEVTQGARGGDFVAPDHLDWLDAYADEVRRAHNPSGVFRFPMAKAAE